MSRIRSAMVIVVGYACALFFGLRGRWRRARKVKAQAARIERDRPMHAPGQGCEESGS